MVKQYLCENCDYTFLTLQENLPKAMASVELETIYHWKHQMIQWVEAYHSGLRAKDTQKKVKKFSSKWYTSHRHIPEMHVNLIYRYFINTLFGKVTWHNYCIRNIWYHLANLWSPKIISPPILSATKICLRKSAILVVQKWWWLGSPHHRNHV